MGVKKDLKGKTLAELEDLFISQGKERYRARQIFRWIYKKLEADFSKMTDLAKTFRKELEEKYYVSKLTPEVTKNSKDGTVKYLFMLEDGEGIETVLIPDGGRKTICISTQVGCRMACQFCASQEGGYVRNLTSGEIINQFCSVETFLRHKGETLTNVVFMGMGEPLDNMDELLNALEILKSELAFKISYKKITVSTCGLIPELSRLVTECDTSIAVSLNATTDELRSELMPINKIYPLGELLRFLKEIKPRRNRKVTVEYLLIKGINDTSGDAIRLAKYLKKSRVKVNLIPYNPSVALPYESPDAESVNRFREILVKEGIQTIIREERGADVDAACGQLRGKLEKETKKSLNRSSSLK